MTTLPALRPSPRLYGASPHCTADDCRRTDTATVDGHNGRRCPAHPPTFDPTRAARLMAAGWTSAAYAYIRTPLPGDLP